MTRSVRVAIVDVACCSARSIASTTDSSGNRSGFANAQLADEIDAGADAVLDADVDHLRADVFEQGRQLLPEFHWPVAQWVEVVGTDRDARLVFERHGLQHREVVRLQMQLGRRSLGDTSA